MNAKEAKIKALTNRAAANTIQQNNWNNYISNRIMPTILKRVEMGELFLDIMVHPNDCSAHYLKQELEAKGYKVDYETRKVPTSLYTDVSVSISWA